MRWTAAVVAIFQSLDSLLSIDASIVLPAGASNFKSPAQNPELAISIKQAERGKANPILEGKIPIWAEFWQRNAKSSKNARKREKLAILAKLFLPFRDNIFSV